jgi:murein DD-endopeptidase MepM/ murein hydrolase activator NlpD
LIRKEKKVRPLFFLLPLILLLAAGGWYLALKYEGEEPGIRFDSMPDAIGAKGELSLQIWDQKSGLRRVSISLLKDGKETSLLEKTYPGTGFLGRGSVSSDELNVPVDLKKFHISDGKAVLQLSVWDYSWRGWWHGNRRYVERPVLIDTVAPRIEVVSRAHNLRQGGSGLVIYRLSEECPVQGVVVGDNFFPGYNGYFKDKQVYVALFALSYLQGKDTPLAIRAVDAAGNVGVAGFPHYIGDEQFRKDKINISDSFLNWKMPELAKGEGLDKASLLEKFLYVNQKLRKENNERAKALCKHSEGRILWDGAFERFPDSATRAHFADCRDYYYHGKKVDQEHHMGMDLASVAHADVPAANSGKIAFAGNLGIYGNTILIDHGLGLFTMYSHLSRIRVKLGEQVTRGQVIANTGFTGMAGGDHLHFGMLVHDIFVNPLEWWDKNWIYNNISSKLNLAAEQFVRAK